MRLKNRERKKGETNLCRMKTMCERKGSRNDKNISKKNKSIGKFQVKLRMNRTDERIGWKNENKKDWLTT